MQCSVLISYIDPNNQKNAISIYLDAVDDSQINASSTVTDHPTINGTPMADHMYKNPTTMIINGTFSLNGKKAIVIDSNGKSLARVEEMFEEIKDKGILCTISKIKVDSDDIPIFTIRNNMVLQSISWYEKINSVKFSFNFREALQASIQTYDVDPDDNFAPDINLPESSSFFDTVLDWSVVDKEVLQALVNYNLAADDFLQYVATLGVGSIVALGVGAAVATALASTLIALGFAASSIPIVGIVIAAATSIVVGIFALVKLIKQRSYKIKAFVYYENATKRDNEVKRFTEFYDSIHQKIQTLDGVIKVWCISENKSQETIVNIDGSYYIFDFEKSNVDAGYAYDVIISDINDVTVKSTNVNIAINAFTDGNDSNILFSTEKSQVYLIHKADTDANDLTNYYICASQIKPSDFSQALTDIIEEAIKY